MVIVRGELLPVETFFQFLFTLRAVSDLRRNRREGSAAERIVGAHPIREMRSDTTILVRHIDDRSLWRSVAANRDERNAVQRAKFPTGRREEGCAPVIPSRPATGKEGREQEANEQSSGDGWKYVHGTEGEDAA